MADLTTHYMGLTLNNPVIAGSSGLLKSLEALKAAEIAGAGAVVLKSIFEEQILLEINQELNATDPIMHPEAMDYIRRLTREQGIDDHLRLVADAKKALKIPVFASINCVNVGDWVEYGQRLENAGADALELNVMITGYKHISSVAIESRYFEILSAVQDKVGIPIALKIGTQFSSIPYMIQKFDEQGVNGLVLFNRYWRPDIDIEKQHIVPAAPFSNPEEFAEPLRWIAILSEEVQCDLCGSTGIHDGRAALKLLMAGAKAIQVCSVLYQKGISYISNIVHEIDAWLDNHHHTHVDEIRGIMGSQSRREMEMWGRTQFIKHSLELE